MSLILRPAKTGDETEFCRVKEQLPMPQAAQNTTTQGGFLLGTNAENYRFFIENAFTNVLEDQGKIVAFAIILPDALVRNSDLWQRKDEIAWQNFDAKKLAEAPLCYFEQLAVLPDSKYRFYGIALAFKTLETAFAAGHAAMFTATVKSPILNLAAVPYLENVGAQVVGTVNENIEGFGNLVSDVYFVERETFARTVAAHRLYRKLKQRLAALSESV